MDSQEKGRKNAAGAREEPLHSGVAPHPHDVPCNDPHCSCHNHEHHHDHGHEHEHGHGHEHEYGHEHGHEHDHDHEHHHDHAPEEPICVTSHAPAIVGSARIQVPLAYEAAVAEVERRMRAVSDRVLEMGGFIGHIKGIVEPDTCRCRISITDGETADKQWLSPHTVCRSDCVFIVFGVECEALRNILQETFADLIP